MVVMVVEVLGVHKISQHKVKRKGLVLQPGIQKTFSFLFSFHCSYSLFFLSFLPSFHSSSPPSCIHLSFFQNGRQVQQKSREDCTSPTVMKEHLSSITVGRGAIIFPGSNNLLRETYLSRVQKRQPCPNLTMWPCNKWRRKDKLLLLRRTPRGSPYQPSTVLQGAFCETI